MDADVDEVHADGQAEISRQTLQIAGNKVIGMKEKKKEKKRERKAAKQEGPKKEARSFDKLQQSRKNQPLAESEKIVVVENAPAKHPLAAPRAGFGMMFESFKQSNGAAPLLAAEPPTKQTKETKNKEMLSHVALLMRDLRCRQKKSECGGRSIVVSSQA